MKLGIIGAGYWGSKIIQSINKAIEVKVFDVKNNDDWRDDTLDAVVIATPPDQHVDQTRWYLQRNIHVLCEKPTSMSVGDQLICNQLAEQNNLVYQAGHILLFQPNIQEMLCMIKDRTVYHVESRRLNWGRLQTNLDLAWHLAPHDISVLDQIYSAEPKKILSMSNGLNNSPLDDYKTYQLTYDNFNAIITLSWHWPKKVRELIVTCHDMQIWADDKELHIIDGGWDESTNSLIKKSVRTVRFNPKCSPLESQINHFITCIEQGTRPLAGTDHMLRVTKTVHRMSNGL